MYVWYGLIYYLFYFNLLFQSPIYFIRSGYHGVSELAAARCLGGLGQHPLRQQSEGPGVFPSDTTSQQ